MQPQLIAGRYQVLRAIGRGGMGTVWLCRDEVLGREVAVKQVGGLPGESANETRRAMREARSAAALNHPNAVAVYDVVDHDGRPWLVMEYVEGQTLADEIGRAERLSPQRVADIGAQLAGALARAHERRIVHRDIKPGNVLIDTFGRPKISDFGIARGHGDDQLTQVGFVTGTPGYLSPELARGGDPHPASDVWALGATLYAAVEGRSPYEPRSNPIALLQAIATERPRPMTHAGALRPAIQAMMHEDPARRWDMATIAKRLVPIAQRDATVVMPRVGSALTAVLPLVDRDGTAAMPLVVRDGTAAMPLVVRDGTAAMPLMDRDGTAAMPLVDRDGTAAMVAPDVVAAQRVESTTRAVQVPTSVRPSRWSGRRWRSRLLPVAAAALLVGLLGVAFLVNQVGDKGGTSEVLGGASATATAPTKTPAADTPKTTRPPATPAEAAAGSDKDLERFVTSYYSQVTKGTDRTWEQLAPKMQGAAGGRNGYDGFWSTIAKVKVNQTRANASANEAVVNLTFTRDDGSTSTETHRFTFVTDGGDYLIESDRNLG